MKLAGKPSPNPVSIHAPAGGATSVIFPKLGGKQFQFTLPRGERLWHLGQEFSELPFQFTLPRGERHVGGVKLHLARDVSIHAPAGGATGDELLDGDAVAVSIHAPAGGATCPRRSGVVWCDVSIHAPAGGATWMVLTTTSMRRFQFTLPRGERRRRPSPRRIAAAFQFTLPRGERQAAAAATTSLVRFQFTLPRGERPSSSGPLRPRS